MHSCILVVILGYVKEEGKGHILRFLSLLSVLAGSSRQFIGFDTEIDESIINRIWDRASEFFPALKEVSLRDLSKSREVRVGLRPYCKFGKKKFEQKELQIVVPS